MSITEQNKTLEFTFSLNKNVDPENEKKLIDPTESLDFDKEQCVNNIYHCKVVMEEFFIYRTMF